MVLKDTITEDLTDEQVTERLGLDGRGSLRERVTAFEVAALGMGSTKISFKNIIQKIAVENQTDLIYKLDLDNGEDSILDTQYAAICKTIRRKFPEIPKLKLLEIVIKRKKIGVPADLRNLLSNIKDADRFKRVQKVFVQLLYKYI